MPQASTSQAVDQSASQAHSVQPLSANLEDRLQDWLEWQVKSVEGVIQATLFSVKPASNHVFAEQGQVTWLAAPGSEINLLSCANVAANNRQVVANKLSHEHTLECLSIPMPLANPEFVLSIVTSVQSQKRRRELSRLVSWGSRWLLQGNRLSQENQNKKTAQQSLERTLVPACLACHSAEEMLYVIIERIAKFYGCERVSLGLVERGRVRVKAISGMSDFDSRMRLVRRIESAMEEMLELKTAIDTSQQQDRQPQPRHLALVTELGGKVVSFPLRDEKSILCVLTIEFAASQLRSQIAAQDITPISGQLTTLLRLRLQRESSLVVQARDRTTAYFGRFTRAPYELKHYVKSLASLGLLIVLLASLVFEGEYRITSRAVIEGNDKQVVVAPYTGFIQSAHARSGDSVAQEDVIATLDVSVLEVEKDKWLSELNKIEKNYAQALAQGNRVELRLAVALRDEINAELALVLQKIERSQIKAPFSGVIVSGDLNQLLGAPVEQGDVLFELASLDQFRLMLDIDERDIAHVHEGQSTTLRLASMPGQTHVATLQAAHPVAVVAEGRNVFRVQAELPESTQLLRPGMQGIARISAGQRSWFWLWTHKLFDQLRVWRWSLSL